MLAGWGRHEGDWRNHKINGRGIYLGQQRLVSATSVLWQGRGRSRLHTPREAAWEPCGCGRQEKRAYSRAWLDVWMKDCAARAH